MRILFPGLIFGICLLILTPASANLLEDARSLINNGKPSQAMSKVTTFLKKQPNNPNALFLKGFALQQMGNSDAAAKIYQSLTKDFPRLPEPYNNLATIYASKGDIEKAKSSLLSALKTHPDYYKIYTNLSELYAKQASDAYQQALGLDKEKNSTSTIKIPAFSALSLDKQNVVATTSNTKPSMVAVANKPEKMNKSRSETLSVTEIEKIKLTISEWAKAWSSQNPEAYLSYYASFFKPKSGSLEEWKKLRQKRLTKPKFIRISLGEIKLQPIANDRVKVSVMQRYQSDTYNDISNKRFHLNRNAKGEWKIFLEYSI